EICARLASSTLVMRPLSCRSRRMRRSTLSSLMRRPAPLSSSLGLIGGLTVIAEADRIRDRMRIFGSFVAALYAVREIKFQEACSQIMEKASCWVVTEGYIGLENQALGVAEGLGLAPILKTVAARQPWRSLPPRLWVDRVGFRALAGELAPPWPDVVVSCGGQAALAAYLIRRDSGGRTFTIHVQKPALPAREFDVLVVPKHDGLTGPNVIVTEGAVHRVTRAKLAEAAERFAARYAHLPNPRVAVLIGGSNNRYRLTAERMRVLAGQFAALAKGGAGLMVTPSRRTEPEAARILAEALAGL